MRATPHRLRRARSEREADADRAAARSACDAGHRGVALLSFPDYVTPIGEEIERALRGARNYAPDVMQLLYVANRYEWSTEIEQRRSDGKIS